MIHYQIHTKEAEFFIKTQLLTQLRSSSLFIFVFASLFLYQPMIYGADLSHTSLQIVQTALEQTNPTQPIDVVVLLDDSGSMATCWPWPRDRAPFTPPCGGPSPNPPTDPDELRYSAARLLLQLADDDDRVAVVRFDNNGVGVGELGTLQNVGQRENRRRLTASLQPPNDYFTRGYTRLDLGLDVVIQLLRNAQEPGRSQYILLLTDGEPSEPDIVPEQGTKVDQQIADLRNLGVLLFPVVLCNPNAGCSGDFLREHFAGFGVREAATAPELLRVFAEVFSAMKPNRSVITNRNANGAIELVTRNIHQVRQLAFVTPRNGLVSLSRDTSPMLSRRLLDDPSIDVNALPSAEIPAGRWAAETAGDDFSSFAVIKADSYPQLLNPPPSIANSPASVRYYPAGHPPLLIARSVGINNSIDEPLLYNGQIPLQPFGEAETRMLLLNDEPDVIELQMGNDSEPLQLVRTFRLEGRADLPRLNVLAPRPDGSDILNNGHARLQVEFGGGTQVDQMTASVYITDESNPDANNDGNLVYQNRMRCSIQMCSDEGFEPQDGRTYNVLYVLQGVANGIRFSDWGQTPLSLQPGIYLSGLPTELDLAQMPPNGWPVEISAGTTEEIGNLTAALALGRVTQRDAATGEVIVEEVSGVQVNFAADVPESGVAQSELYIQGLENLRPGEYVGELALRANSPAGRPIDVTLRPSPVFPVALNVARPAANLEQELIDFGEVLFDTSPNFRLDQSIDLPITFVGGTFRLKATPNSSNCSQLKIIDAPLETAGNVATLPLQLTSPGPMQPQLCTGTLRLDPPNADYDVSPNVLEWQVRVSSVEWSVVSGDLNLADLQDAGGRVETPLLIRFNGKTPFVIQAQAINAEGSNAAGREEGQPVLLNAENLDLPPIEISGPLNAAGLYEVPLNLIARQEIPKDSLQGTFYSGAIQLGIVGLPDDIKTVNFNFRSPSLIQRYIEPIVVPIYSLPWLLCSGPLSLLLLLVLLARMRNLNFREDEVEETAAAATMQMASQSFTEAAENAATRAGALEAPPLVNPSQGTSWGASEWGDAWGGASSAGGSSGSQPRSAPPTNDPWGSSW